jgi:hypothetical protein
MVGIMDLLEKIKVSLNYQRRRELLLEPKAILLSASYCDQWKISSRVRKANLSILGFARP